MDKYNWAPTVYITIVMALFIYIVLPSPSQRPQPLYKPSTLVVIKHSRTAAIVTGTNGYSKLNGWTYRIVLVQTQVKIPRIPEEDLKLPGAQAP